MIEPLADRELDEDATLSFSFNVGDDALGLASVTAASGNTALVPETAAHLAVSGTGTTRTLTIKPSAGESGFANITVTATADDGRSVSDSFVLSVRAVNDAPAVTVTGTQTTSQNVPVTFSLRTATHVYVEDADAGPKAVKVILNATGGRTTLATTAALTFLAGDGRDDTLMSFTGTLVNVNAALNGLRFTPNAGFSGAATLQVTVSDQGHVGMGGALAATEAGVERPDDVNPHGLHEAERPLAHRHHQPSRAGSEARGARPPHLGRRRVPGGEAPAGRRGRARRRTPHPEPKESGER